MDEGQRALMGKFKLGDKRVYNIRYTSKAEFSFCSDRYAERKLREAQRLREKRAKNRELTGPLVSKRGDWYVFVIKYKFDTNYEKETKNRH